MISRGIHRGAANDFFERDSHGEKLRHDVDHRDGPPDDAFQVRVGRNGIGKETLLDGRDGVAKPKAPAAVAHVKDDTALASFQEYGV